MPCRGRRGFVAVWRRRSWSQLFFGKLTESVRNGTADSQSDRPVSDRLPPEAIANGVDGAVGHQAGHASLRARAALLVCKPEREIELHMRILLEMRHGDRQKRYRPFVEVIRENREHQLLG